MRERGGACQDGSEAARPGDTRLLFKRSPRNESEPSKLLESDVSLGTFTLSPGLKNLGGTCMWERGQRRGKPCQRKAIARP